jgi:phosphatidate cytidylyltransferase
LKQIIIRAISGSIFVALTIGSILVDPFFFAGIFLVFCVIAIIEFYQLFKHTDVHPQMISGIVAGILTYALFVSYSLDFFLEPGWMLLMIPALSVPLVIELYRKKAQPFQNIAITLLPVLYIALPLAMMSLLGMQENKDDPYSPNILLGFFFIVWTGDIMAYLGGMAFGRHPLFERISPKKSWEGSLSGALFSLGMGAFLSIFFKDLGLLQWMGMAAVIVVTGTFGDLVESMLKRSVQIKDSGNIMPGHGGVLDRFDSVLIAAPFVFLYLCIIKNLV